MMRHGSPFPAVQPPTGGDARAGPTSQHGQRQGSPPGSLAAPAPQRPHGRQHGGVMAENYDVIIIGTGAGGGTLAHTLAGSGKRILLLERGDFLPREMDNWDPQAGVRRREVHLQGHLVRPGRQAVPAAGPLLRGRGDQDVRRGPVPAAARRTSARSSTSTGSPRPGRCPMTTSSRGTPGPSSCIRCTATAARTRPRATGRSRTRGRAVSHEPRLQQISDGLAKGGWHPFHAPCGILLDEADRPRSTCIRCTWCDGYPCLVHAKSDAEVIAVRPVLGRETSRC